MITSHPPSDVLRSSHWISDDDDDEARTSTCQKTDLDFHMRKQTWLIVPLSLGVLGWGWIVVFSKRRQSILLAAPWEGLQGGDWYGWVVDDVMGDGWFLTCDRRGWLDGWMDGWLSHGVGMTFFATHFWLGSILLC